MAQHNEGAPLGSNDRTKEKFPTVAQSLTKPTSLFPFYTFTLI
jgi:hypothetical protein